MQGKLGKTSKGAKYYENDCRLIRICRIHWYCSPFRFRLEIPLLCRLGSKYQNCWFSWNLAASLTRICRSQWWYSLFLFRIGNALSGQIWSKSQNCQFKANFDTETISSMGNLMMLIMLFVFWLEIPFLRNFFPKAEIVYLNWSLVPKLIWIYWIQSWFSLFLFLTGNTLIEQFSSKMSKLSVYAENL